MRQNIVSRRSILFGMAIFFLAAIAPSISWSYTANVNDTSTTPNFPYPHSSNTSLTSYLYRYGYSPTNMTSSFVQTYYTNWCTQFVTNSGVTRSGSSNCSNCYRVQRTSNSNDTVSEGVGYGMLIAAYMADKTFFDGLYRYAKQWMPDASGRYLMDWQIDSNGNRIGQNGATDADEDMAFALLVAEKQWGNTTSTGFNYHKEFQNICDAMYLYEFGGNGEVYAGDQHASANYFSSYMCPAWYKCFSTQSSTSGQTWTPPITWTYNTYFFSGSNSMRWTKGLAPNCATSSYAMAAISGGTGNEANADRHGYDASRYGWRIGVDYIWNGTSGPLSLMKAFSNTINTTGVGNIGDGWTVSTGASTSASNSVVQAGPALVGAMAGASAITSGSQAFVNSVSTEVQNRVNSVGKTHTWDYFGDTLNLVCCLVASKNFPNLVCDVNPCAPNVCTATPTPVPGPCFMLDDLQDGNLINATNGAWYAFRWTSSDTGNGSIAVTPWLADVLCKNIDNCPLILDSTYAAEGSGYSAKVTGWFANNGYGSPATYSGFALATDIGSGYSNLGWMQSISFSVRASQPCTLRLNFNNPTIAKNPIVWQGVTVGGGGNDDQYGFIFTVGAANTWEAKTGDVSGIACQEWGSKVVNGVSMLSCPYMPTASTSITRDLALSDVKSLQWLTQSNNQSMGTTVNLTFWIDKVCITAKSGQSIPPTATPIVTPVVGTSTFTPTRTPSPTSTGTPTLTLTRTSTSTATSTITNTGTPTRTVTTTPTSTRTNTATSTSTSVPNTSTFTPTATSTVTSTATPTPSSTRTASATSTNTPSSTRTASATNTSTATATNTTVVNTSTATSTPTRTNTATATATATSTRTNSPTNTATLTSTPVPNTSTYTPTSTSTASNTRTSTATATSSFTSTVTSSPTITSTITWTVTGTQPATGTFTVTSSPTLTPTVTHTATSTSTFTNTLTRTNTATATSTRTSTATSTDTPLVNTSTPTSTSVANTSTPTRTSTATVTSSNTRTETSTPTISSTPTETSTGTQPPTSTFTWTGTSTSTATSTRTATVTATLTNTNVPVFTFTMTATPTTTSTATSTATSSNTLTATNTRTATSTNTSTATSTVTSTSTSTTTATPSSTATDTSTSTWTSTATNTSTNTSTSTSTATYTSTATWTATYTPTFTATSTWTPTSSYTPTFTFTATSTSTSTVVFTVTETPTNTPSGSPLNPIVYPNPVNGDVAKVSFTLNESVSSVSVEVVTDSFRKVYKNLVYGTAMKSRSCNNGAGGFNIGRNTICLDMGDLNLSNGLYYVIIRLSDGTHAVAKFAITH